MNNSAVSNILGRQIVMWSFQFAARLAGSLHSQLRTGNERTPGPNPDPSPEHVCHFHDQSPACFTLSLFWFTLNLNKTKQFLNKTDWNDSLLLILTENSILRQMLCHGRSSFFQHTCTSSYHLKFHFQIDFAALLFLSGLTSQHLCSEFQFWNIM